MDGSPLPRRPRIAARRLPPALALLLGLLPGGALAESALRLPMPSHFGEIAAATYAEAGDRLGAAAMRSTRLPNGNVRLEGVSGIEGAVQTTVSADLEPVDDGRSLRIVREQSESVDAQGATMGLLTIDHERGVARCGAPTGSDRGPTEVALPDPDRVVNVPLNLLFERLVSGEEAEVEFQILLCRFGTRILDARAARVRDGARGDGELIEVAYEVDFGPLLSPLARPFMPKLSFWFDPAAEGGWVAHRMPLYTKGPTVLVMRSGFSPGSLAPPP